MRFLIKSIFLCIALVVSLIAKADYTSLPIRTIDGKAYHYYEVQPKETVYSLCRRFEISREDLIKYNPSVADGLKANQILLFPARQQAAPKAKTYVVQRGDSGYGICRRFGIDLNEFYKLNPQARDGVKAGETVIVGYDQSGQQVAQSQSQTQEQTSFIPSVAKQPETPKPSVQGNKYTVVAGDTFYGIARRFGISPAQLMGANPNVDMLREGMVIELPQSCAEYTDAPTTVSAQPTQPEEVAETEPVEPTPTRPIIPAYVTEQDSIVIAVALPFMLHQQQRSKQAKLYTEFYKGFLLAVDSMRNCGTPIHILAFDTEGSDEGVSRILDNPELRSAQTIIAPDNADALRRFADFGHKNKINVLNLFVVKDESYRTNPYLMQANIPHHDMYRKAVDQFIMSMGYYTPVILNNTAANEKSEFVDMLKKALTAAGKKYLEITYTGTPTEANFASIDRSGNYAFIPSGGRQADINKILVALLELQAQMTDPAPIKLYGYPEWITFKGETLANMHRVDTSVFSRFYARPDDMDLTNVENAFANWYGSRMAAYVPRQGLLGFDVAMYLIKSLEINHGDFEKYSNTYYGVQNGFDFRKTSDFGGWVNNELYFINFQPSGMISKLPL